MSAFDDQDVDGSAAPEGGRSFVASCYETFLGRGLEAIEVAEERSRWPVREILHSIIGSEEFTDAVALSLRWPTPFPGSIFRDSLTIRHKLWVVDWLPIDPGTAEQVLAAGHWRALLVALVADERLMRIAGAACLVDLPPFMDDGTDQPGSGAAEAPAGDSELRILGANSG